MSFWSSKNRSKCKKIVESVDTLFPLNRVKGFDEDFPVVAQLIGRSKGSLTPDLFDETKIMVANSPWDAMNNIALAGAYFFKVMRDLVSHEKYANVNEFNSIRSQTGELWTIKISYPSLTNGFNTYNANASADDYESRVFDNSEIEVVSPVSILNFVASIRASLLDNVYRMVISTKDNNMVHSRELDLTNIRRVMSDSKRVVLLDSDVDNFDAHAFMMSGATGDMLREIFEDLGALISLRMFKAYVIR